MLDLDQSIIERPSTRMFLPRPVPQELVEQSLALAQHRAVELQHPALAARVRQRHRPKST